jgi:hypothetical protein
LSPARQCLPGGTHSSGRNADRRTRPPSLDPPRGAPAEFAGRALRRPSERVLSGAEDAQTSTQRQRVHRKAVESEANALAGASCLQCPYITPPEHGPQHEIVITGVPGRGRSKALRPHAREICRDKDPQAESASLETTCGSNPDPSGPRQAAREVAVSGRFQADFEHLSTCVHSPARKTPRGRPEAPEADRPRVLLIFNPAELPQSNRYASPYNHSAIFWTVRARPGPVSFVGARPPDSRGTPISTSSPLSGTMRPRMDSPGSLPRSRPGVLAPGGQVRAVGDRASPRADSRAPGRLDLRRAGSPRLRSATSLVSLTTTRQATSTAVMAISSRPKRQG